MARSILTVVALLLAGSASAADGAAIYKKNCESCHGNIGQGGSGKAIAGQPVSFVKEVVEFHPPPMEKLKFPAGDVDAVSRFVSSLAPSKKK